jgi:RNA polymerase sigma factor (sigma-70 family)
MLNEQNFGLSASECESLQRGNQRLQTRVFDKYAPSFVEIAIKKWGMSLEDAKDIVSGAFAKMFLNFKDNKIEATKLDGYVYTIVMRKSQEYSKKKEKEILQSVAILPNVVAGEEESNNYLKQLLNSGFNLLGEKCQKLLNSYYFDKKSHKEIALELGISEDASKSRKKECIKELKKIIKKIK